MVDYYHGTRDFKNAVIAFDHGIRSKDVLIDKPGKQSPTSLSPIKGRVYFTPDLIHALRFMFGPIGWSHPGGLLVIPESVVRARDTYPDEDEVGELLGKLFSARYYTLYQKLEIVDPKDNPPQPEWEWLWNLAQKYLKPAIFQRAIVGHGGFALWGRVGKILLPRMTQQQLRQVFTRTKGVSIAGRVMPTELWRFDRMKSDQLEPGYTNFFQLAELINKRDPPTEAIMEQVTAQDIITLLPGNNYGIDHRR